MKTENSFPEVDFVNRYLCKSWPVAIYFDPKHKWCIEPRANSKGECAVVRVAHAETPSQAAADWQSILMTALFYCHEVGIEPVGWDEPTGDDDEESATP